MVEVGRDQKEILVSLFQGLEDSLILSCIQNYFGTAWVNDLSSPTSGRIIVGDYCFLAGEPREELLRVRSDDLCGRSGNLRVRSDDLCGRSGNLHVRSDDLCGRSGNLHSTAEDLRGAGDGLLPAGMVLVPDSPRWHPVIEKLYGVHCQKKERYAIKKEGDIFDRELLNGYANGLEDGYVLREIDQSIYDILMSGEWSRDFCKEFHDWEHFRDRGMGVVVCMGEEIVAGASSYTSYREGIEVEIITREDYRRRGLALACGSALILKALEKNLYPNWDAANMASVAVATKLGYHYDKPYEVYKIY